MWTAVGIIVAVVICGLLLKRYASGSKTTTFREGTMDSRIEDARRRAEEEGRDIER